MAGGLGLAGADEDEFTDFISRVEDVSKTIAGLKEGTIDPNLADEAVEKTRRQEEAELARRQAKRRAKIEERLLAQAEAQERETLREVHAEKIEELKRDYYHRKNRRERWEQYRRDNPSRATDFRGWDLFEEDPDEDLWAHESGQKPQVQDQAAFDAMAKDVEERAARRAAARAAADAERARGNAALAAGQPSEALGCYSRALEFDKSEKALYTNRALAHMKVGNFLSAAEDCSKALEIAEFLDDCLEARPAPPLVLKARLRRAAAYSALGRHGDAEADVRAALRTAGESDVPECQRLLRQVDAERAEEAKEAKALGAADAADAAGAADRSSVQRVHALVEALHAAAPPPPPVRAAARKGGAGAGGTAEAKAESGMRKVAITADDDDDDDGGGGGGAAAGDGGGDGGASGADGAAPAAAPDAGGSAHAEPPTHAPPTRAQADAHALDVLRELTPLLLRADAHRATARQCGLVGWLCAHLGEGGALGMACARALVAACLSPRAQHELLAKGGADKLLLALNSQWAELRAPMPLPSDTERADSPAAREAAEACAARFGATQLAEARLDALRLCAATERLHDALVGAIGARAALRTLSEIADADAADAADAADGDGAAEASQIGAEIEIGAEIALPSGPAAAAAMAERGARAALATSAVHLLANLSSSPKFKALLVAAATNTKAPPGAAGGCEALAVLARAARDERAGRSERRHSAVQALGNLSASGRLRAALCALGVPAAVSAATLGLLRAAPRASARESASGARALDATGICFVANSAAALHNLCTDEEAVSAHCAPLAGPLCALLARPELAADTDIGARLLALLGKCARCEGVHGALADGGALGLALSLLDASLRGAGAPRASAAARGLAAPAATPRFEEVTDEAAAAEEAAAAGGGAADDDDADATEAGMDAVGPALKLLTLMLHADARHAAELCDKGAIPTLTGLLTHAAAHVQGNAALAVGELARDERCLAVLAAQPKLVQYLLAIAHHRKGQLQRNAAIALARLAKNSHCLGQIREQHGMQILMQYVKPP